jgi:hypothetical protein
MNVLKKLAFLVEMQAMLLAMDHFDTYLRERRFSVFTDHKLLETQSKCYISARKEAKCLLIF